MPNSLIAGIAKKYSVDMKTVEREWEKAKQTANETLPDSEYWAEVNYLTHQFVKDYKRKQK